MLEVGRTEHAVLWTIHRPEARNALDTATIQMLLDAIDTVDDDARCAIIAGRGGIFVSGGDLNELRQRDTRADAATLSDLGHTLTTAIAKLPIPVIAAIEGAAIGGGAELAIACDMRIATESAGISFKQTRMGVTTAWGSLPRLTALVGSGSAARLLLAGHTVSGVDAKAMGLIDEISPNPVATAIEWSTDIAKAAPAAVAASKRLLRAAIESPTLRDLERAAFIDTWSSDAHKEAVAAYFERRAPRWK